jgi:hypothetical protein
MGGKKPAEEESKPEINLTSALPSNDDFRTSLLMTGLSARFSMLREQDDPSSKLGKASDDSVLYPKRQSRMDFGLGLPGGLDDIAEVESIKAPSFPRMGSFQSDDAQSLSGSIMNRGKPTEGNNLFGGRQKIYKINANGSTKDGLPGRALYDDDVASSAFQRWRQAEKERSSLDDDTESTSLRPVSPSQSEFNRRRETSSTTSSAPSGGRNSTAATSVASNQPNSSLKEWQPATGNLPHSATQGPPVERSVTRTRRLYEQSLTQDLHDQQSSSLSRMDTLSRQRHFGSRTPEVGGNSPTMSAFNERVLDRKPQILSKASAPNLRSFSPPATVSSQTSPAESSTMLPILEAKTYNASPPLSPPISESDELSTLGIQPNDRGKATALGVFNRPAQPYDESKYAQRQRQLQQGRETPTSRVRAESNSSAPTDRSRSSSSLHRTPFEKTETASVPTQPTVHEETSGGSFLNIDEDEDVLASVNTAAPARSGPQLRIERPSDQDHPAFRQSALPTPLSIKSSDGIPVPEHSPKADGPADSPTLGPGSGLSGMVRQHLRNVSTASSNYGPGSEEFEAEGQNASSVPTDSKSLEHLSVGSNPWDQQGTWEPTVAEASHPTSPPSPAYLQTSSQTSPTISRQDESQRQDGRGNDEFARHLADGAKRVRERLTSYVESDHSRSTSPSLPPTEPSADISSPPSRGNAFSVLRSKSSRGSLAERERRDASQTRSKKLLGLGVSQEAAPLPPPNKQVFDSPGPAPIEEDSSKDRNSDDQAEASDGTVHAGLKAFRQARRELQRMREIEVQQRYQAPQKAPPAPPTHDSPPSSSGRGYGDESRFGGGSRAGSLGPSDRQRSGSDTSGPGYAQQRPPPVRTASSPNVDQGSHPANGAGANGLGVRNAGPVGGEYRRSPLTPSGDASGRFYEHQGLMNGGRVGAAASTPNLHGSPSAPPLPPINPRRKTLTRYSDDEASGSPPPMPMSPDKPNGHRGPMRMSDDEDASSHYRQRLRQAAISPTGLSDRGRPRRASPPYDPARPPYVQNNVSGGLPGGMI